MATLVRSLRTQLTAAFCSMLLVPGGPVTVALTQEQQQAAVADEQAPKIPNDQLDSLVAPIALTQIHCWLKSLLHPPILWRSSSSSSGSRRTKT